MQLWYFDDRTPEGWQPKHFREADPSELKFSKGSEDEEIEDKLKIKIGDLATPHHTLSVYCSAGVEYMPRHVIFQCCTVSCRVVYPTGLVHQILKFHTHCMLFFHQRGGMYQI